MTLDKMADRVSKYPEFVQTQSEVVQSFNERAAVEALFRHQVQKVPKKMAAVEAQHVARRARDASINRSLQTLRSMYGQYVKDHPKQLSKGDIPHMPKIQDADNIGRGFIGQSGYDAIYNEMPENLRPLLQFLYITGFRSGAAKQITWNMVEWEKRGNQNVATELRIPVGFMKNKEQWKIPLVGPLEAVAKTFGHGFQHIDMPVFNSTNFRREWNKACGKLGFGLFNKQKNTYYGLHPHDMRRSASRNLIGAGVPQTVAQKITGHKSSRMFDRYNITSDYDVTDALMKVGKYSEAQKAAAKSDQKADERSEDQKIAEMF